MDCSSLPRSQMRTTRAISTALALSFFLASATLFLTPQLLKVLNTGPSIADDTYFAMVAKNLALTGKYALPLAHSPPALFDPEISSGPGLIVPGAIAIAIFGPQFWVPSGTTLALFVAQLASFFVILAKRYETRWVAIYGSISILTLCVLTTYRGFYSFFVGEAPACGYFLVGCAVLHVSRRRGALYTAGLFFSAALLTKLILLFSVAGACAAWFFLNINRQPVIRHVVILGMGIVTPLVLFELTRFLVLGFDGYVENWGHFFLFMSSQHVPPTDRLSAVLTELADVYQMNLPFLLCLGAAAGLALTTLFKRDRMDFRGLELGAMFAAAALFGFVYFAFFSNVWSRYLWQSAFAVSFAIGSPLLAVRSFALVVCTAVVALSVISPWKLESFYRLQTTDTDGRIMREKREVLHLLEEHRKLPLLGQSWHSIFDIVYLLPKGRQWSTLGPGERVVGRPAVVIWNQFINRTGKYDEFPSSVESHCSRLAPELKFYTVHLCE